MFKNLKQLVIGMLAALVVIAVGASAYTAFASAQPAVAAQSASPAAADVQPGQDLTASLQAIAPSDLSEAEAAGLLFMIEEEKLARDVYTELFAAWGLPTFQNIASSEQVHMDSIKLLLDRYSLTDPAMPAGQYSNAGLQQLHDDLIARGSQSAPEALKVGGLIEETDIADLQERLDQTDNADIQLVYSNLLNGSYNHLRAFASALSNQTAEVYAPQILTAEQYQTIIAGSSGNGYQNGQAGQAGAGVQGGAAVQGGNAAGGAYGRSNGRGGNGSGSAAGAAVAGGAGSAQAAIAGTTTVHGVIASYDVTGMNLTLDDGTSLYVQLGSSRYASSVNLAPYVGMAVTVEGFEGDLGLFTATRVTIDATGEVFDFRSTSGRPLWAGGNGNGHGNRGGQ
jgi:hypothetical protein